MVNGVLILNKETGYTSFDVVKKVGHIIGTKKIGHTGTLDPLATGVLVLTIGKYTKLNEVLTSTYKEYEATFRLGIKTDTLDITGKVLSEIDVKISEKEIRDVINKFVGIYSQEVPLYSAVKINGKKLYQYARLKQEVKLPKRDVEIKKIDILKIDNDEVTINTLVSKGTYIRSLIRDIGDKLQVGATMTSLIRIKQGDFSLKEAYSIKDVENNNYKLLKLEDILDLELINNYHDLNKIRNGVKIKYDTLKEYILFKENDKEVALYVKDNDIYKMFIYLEEKDK